MALVRLAAPSLSSPSHTATCAIGWLPFTNEISHRRSARDSDEASSCHPVLHAKQSRRVSCFIYNDCLVILDPYNVPALNQFVLEFRESANGISRDLCDSSCLSRYLGFNAFT